MSHKTVKGWQVLKAMIQRVMIPMFGVYVQRTVSKLLCWRTEQAVNNACMHSMSNTESARETLNLYLDWATYAYDIISQQKPIQS